MLLGRSQALGLALARGVAMEGLESGSGAMLACRGGADHVLAQLGGGSEAATKT